ncbi:hypothetical protein J1614_002981 [Plenodomus biglobosus]|nr:hypothetical protein J1614_002981 [Plenodomus biglobosus]
MPVLTLLPSVAPLLPSAAYFTHPPSANFRKLFRIRSRSFMSIPHNFPLLQKVGGSLTPPTLPLKQGSAV